MNKYIKKIVISILILIGVFTIIYFGRKIYKAVNMNKESQKSYQMIRT